MSLKYVLEQTHVFVFPGECIAYWATVVVVFYVFVGVYLIPFLIHTSLTVIKADSIKI